MGFHGTPKILYIQEDNFLEHPVVTGLVHLGTQVSDNLSYQWPFQDPKMEVPTIYKAYIRPM